MNKILIIEDDISIAELERDYLEAENFIVDIISDGEKGLSTALGSDYSLIVLDVMLPSMDGFKILREIRQKKETPILMVSAKKEDFDKIRGLGLGADDYMTKPFSPSEMTARVKAHINRYNKLSGALTNNETMKTINIRGLELNREYKSVKHNGEQVILTSKEFEILYLLMSNPNKVYSKQEIFDQIWGDSYGDISTITVHIRKIREKIENDPSTPEYIETLWGIGYRFPL
ncbi:response regulator transcription factor [Thiospirochaeta perfilievii]|uniref:Phosphate regulon transcriptional regulatory protein PhoB n=1 Tax=Thiospirochaeta perfilievii TaxID=252967 RepID=A0A5C1QA13_9SPIO|nr:response regulator transcription factor [Thiospirochaeta perfilievii]QEN04178.1 response regulator transcription factor [Thiospirochaeta perfilievii]